MSYSSFVFFFSLIFVACFYSTSSEEVLSTTSFNFLEETTGLPSNWPDTFVSNTTFVNETGIEVPKPDVLPVDTLRGKNVLQVIERLLFQRSFQDLPEPLPSIINFIIRIPVVIIGLILGENVELLGLQALHVGDALLLTGAQGYGYAVKDYAIGFVAFGKTIKEWFVNNNLPESAAHLTTEDASFGLLWNEIGKAYLRTRIEIEELYGSHF